MADSPQSNSNQPTLPYRRQRPHLLPAEAVREDEQPTAADDPRLLQQLQEQAVMDPEGGQTPELGQSQIIEHAEGASQQAEHQSSDPEQGLSPEPPAAAVTSTLDRKPLSIVSNDTPPQNPPTEPAGYSEQRLTTNPDRAEGEQATGNNAERSELPSAATVNPENQDHAPDASASEPEPDSTQATAASQPPIQTSDTPANDPTSAEFAQNIFQRRSDSKAA